MNKYMLFIGLALATAIGGCKGSEYCENKCDCEGCSDKELQECVINAQAEADVASAYDCSDQYDAYMECALTNSSCEDGDYWLDSDSWDECLELAEDYYDCESDASDLYKL